MRKYLLLITFLLALFATRGQKLSLNDCAARYDSLERFLIQFKKSNPDEDFAAGDSIFNKLRSCLQTSKYFNLLDEKWTSLKEDWNQYQAMDKNLSTHADRSRVLGQLTELEKNLRDYRYLIFPDNELKKKMNRMLTASEKDSWNGIPFFKSTADSLNSSIKSLRKANYWLDSAVRQLTQTLDSLDTVIRKLNKIYEENVTLREQLLKAFSDAADTARLVFQLNTAIYRDADSIKYFLFKRDTSFNTTLTLAAFSEHIFSAGFAHIISRLQRNIFALSAGGELFYAPNSKKKHRWGLAANVGLQHRSLLWEAGLIFLNTPGLSADVTWKTGLLYYPFKSPVLIGLGYSPLTNWGLRLGVVLKKKSNR